MKFYSLFIDSLFLNRFILSVLYVQVAIQLCQFTSDCLLLSPSPGVPNGKYCTYLTFTISIFLLSIFDVSIFIFVIHCFFLHSSFFIFHFLSPLGPSIQYLAKQKSWQLLSEEHCFQVSTEMLSHNWAVRPKLNICSPIQSYLLSSILSNPILPLLLYLILSYLILSCLIQSYLSYLILSN